MHTEILLKRKGWIRTPRLIRSNVIQIQVLQRTFIIIDSTFWKKLQT